MVILYLFYLSDHYLCISYFEDVLLQLFFSNTAFSNKHLCISMLKQKVCFMSYFKCTIQEHSHTKLYTPNSDVSTFVYGPENSTSKSIQYTSFTSTIFLEMSNSITINTNLSTTHTATKAAHLHNWMH